MCKACKVAAIFASLIICAVSVFTIRSFYNADELTEAKENSEEICESFVVSEVTDEPSVACSENEEERLSEEDIELIALVTMAEAEGECEDGKRLVIDTILNRVDSHSFPDTVYDVIYQSWQFTSMWNGRAERCEVREDICRLVREELEARTNSDVIFFTAGCYSDYGTPMFKVGNHYFSRER